MKIDKLQIKKVAMGGHGLGFHDDKAIFVPNTAIGDLVSVKITHAKKDHAFARVTEYLERGPGVTDSGCEAFDAEEPCGGCDWLMLEYPTQLAYKESLMQELFKDAEVPFGGIIPSEHQHHYRNKVYMPVGEGYSYGIYARYSHRIVPHTACRIHPGVFDEIAALAMELCQKAGVEVYSEATHRGCLRHIGLRCNRDQSEILVVLVCRSARLPFSKTIVRGLTDRFPQIVGVVQNINRVKGNVILGKEEKLLWGRDYLTDRLADLVFRIHYRSFWQVNIPIMENILNMMRSELDKSSRLIDAYCGIGAIGLSLANGLQEVVGIEEMPEAVEDANLNARENGFTNARFISGKFELLLGGLMRDFAADSIVLDPPRGGVPESSLLAIRKAGIAKVLYLSCSPMNLARDLRVLTQGGRYRLKALQSFDMFPNTWHIESLAVLELES